MGTEGLPPTLRWEGGASGAFFVLEQTLLPEEETEIRLATVADVVDAIRRLAVRGAPAIGIAAAYGTVLGAQAVPENASREQARIELERVRDLLAGARPTAVNLAWAVDRLARVWRDEPTLELPEIRERLHREAVAVHDEDRRACEEMGRLGSALVRDGGTYLTHCNAGALATGGIGTALGVFHAAAREGKRLTVYADETRPLLQGARLTAWELSKGGVEVVLICDSAAAGVLLAGDVDAVFVGSDRIAANGDVANKVGTLSVALAAKRAGIPFYVVAPTSTFDLSLSSGREIPIEERPSDEVTDGPGGRIASPGVRARNPAFDVTPADLITAIVTEKGLVRPPTPENVARCIRA